MPKYPLTCLDYQLQDGQPFTVTVCGYSGKVKYMVIGPDTTRHLRPSSVDITGGKCEAGMHCLALNCPLNRTEPLHLGHILEMWSDEPLDEETARMCGTKSAVDLLVKFADKMNEVLPEELRKRQEPVKDTEQKLEDVRK